MIRRNLISIIVIVSIAILCMVGMVFADGMNLVFSEDFSEDEIGAFPSRLVVDRGRIEYLRVVEDSTAVGGKALMIMGDPETNDTRVHVELPELLFFPPVFEIEFSLRVENSDGTNFYLNDSEAVAFLIISPKDGKLRYNLKDDIATLDSGWNRIKLVVDLETAKVYVYLNNMDVPILGPASFYKERQCTAREGLYLRYQLSRGTKHPDFEGEIYIDDIKVRMAGPNTELAFSL